MDLLKNKKVVIGVIAGVIVLIALITVTLAVVLRPQEGKAVPASSASSTVAVGPGSWEATCIYTNDLAVAEKDPANVCSLDLFDQKLTAIPPAVFTMTNLEYLNLAGNNITAVPEQIGDLTHLKYLYLNQNPIASLPSSVANLTSLKVLSLEWDDLASIPSTMNELKSLRSIIVMGNPLPTSTVAQMKQTFADASIVF